MVHPLVSTIRHAVRDVKCVNDFEYITCATSRKNVFSLEHAFSTSSEGRRGGTKSFHQVGRLGLSGVSRRVLSIDQYVNMSTSNATLVGQWEVHATCKVLSVGVARAVPVHLFSAAINSRLAYGGSECS